MKKHTHALTLKRTYLVVILLLLSLALQACDETSDPSSPEDGATEYTVSAGSRYYLREGPTYNWSQGYDANGLFYWANTSTGTPYNAVTWEVPFTTPGRYNVQTYIPQVISPAGNVSYRIFVNGVQRSLSLNQSNSAGNWVSLGTFYFTADGSEYIELDNVTPRNGYRIVFDAMRWTAQ